MEYPNCEICGRNHGTFDECASCGGKHLTCPLCYIALNGSGLSKTLRGIEKVSILYVCPRDWATAQVWEGH